jgi:hypothetical protein
MGVSGQRHAPAALYSRGKDPVPIGFSVAGKHINKLTELNNY